MQNNRPTLNPVLKSFWTTQARNKVLYGGRASSKSWDAAGMATFLTNKYPLKFLCTRQIQNKIEESVYALLKHQIHRFGLSSRFRILNNKILNTETGSEFLFYGLNRHIEEIKSLEGVDILWCEEAHALTEQQWQILEPTIRKEGSECWFTFNPKLMSDFVWRYFVVDPPANTLVRQINYNENQFISKTMLDVINDAKKRDPDLFTHIYLGVPLSDDDVAVIKSSWIETAIDAHKKLGIAPSGMKRLGFDIADTGDDLCATVLTHGSLVTWCDEWKGKEDELLKSCTRVWRVAQEHNAEITYDSIGVGATAGAKFGELNTEHRAEVGYRKFNAGGTVFRPEREYQPKIKNIDFFSNLKAQAWWTVADRLRNTYNAVTNGERFAEDDMIFIDSTMPNLKKLKFELATPHRDFDRNGRVVVEAKKDLQKRNVKSPNLADAFIMAFAPVKRPLNITKHTLRRA